jgi:hypothetical protein
VIEIELRGEARLHRGIARNTMSFTARNGTVLISAEALPLVETHTVEIYPDAVLKIQVDLRDGLAVEMVAK